MKSEPDIAKFWECFSRIRDRFRLLGMPYFRNFTSLCHLLMDLGFDCAKPDSAVMKAAVSLTIVPAPPKQKRNPEKSRPHSEENLRKAVLMMQKYALYRDTRATVVDLYFLIHGGQLGVAKFIRRDYYPARDFDRPR